MKVIQEKGSSSADFCVRTFFNLFMPSGFFNLNSLDKFIFYIWGELNANSVDPDQTPHSVASDLGLYYLSVYGR